jgi:uncharacterized protein (DUF305 family)
MTAGAISLLAFALLWGAAPAASNDAPFARDNAVAMERMHAAMMAVRPSGDADRDFAAMMIAHHQGAIDMARLELRYGKDETLRRLAQEIIVTQGQEIGVMRRAAGLDVDGNHRR